MAAINISYVYTNGDLTLTEGNFGILDGEPIKKFTWKTKNGLEVTVISYGAIIQAVKYPDRYGQVSDVALGFDDIQGYVSSNHPDKLGCVIGRCVNRIKNATFTIDSVQYNVSKNWKDHFLHGGEHGFDKINWQSTVDGTKVTFSHISKDGDQGFPGDLFTNITYEVTDDGTFSVDYLALTNKKTVVNLTNHSYFNLAGHETGAVGLYDHTVVINSDKVLEGDEDWIPNGKFKKVGGTPYDLRSAKKLGEVINNNEDLRFHHNYVINRNGKEDLTFVSRVEHPPSGRFMEVYSDQPSVVFYTGNYIHGQGHPDMFGKDRVLYGRCGGLCLEPMNLVDAVHHENFPSPILAPGQVYKNKMYFTFGSDSRVGDAA